MPRARSIAIQSEVTPRRPALPCTAPACVIADACSASASVSVDLPASGWLMTANARRLPASASTPASPVVISPRILGCVNDRILTIPNGISVARLAGVPVFLWLVLGPHADAWAVGVLIASGISDWLDGKIARALNQTSRLGQLLDPAADRLYIAATIIALAVRGIIPWWLVAVLGVRELAVGGALELLRRRTGIGGLQVSLVGKAATLCLLYAFPLVLLGAYSGWGGTLARVIGWAFVIWGIALYWQSALLYLIQVRGLLRDKTGLASA